MWTYRQSDGELLHDGAFEGTGYSGTGIGRNNPAMEAVANEGPIPAGSYSIGRAHDESVLGPCVFALTPHGDTHGRSEFYVHGDNARHDASEGCVILGPSIRHLIRDSGDTALEVIA